MQRAKPVGAEFQWEEDSCHNRDVVPIETGVCCPSAATEAVVSKRKGDNRWLWTVICLFGLLSFVPFVWAAVQVRTRRFVTAAIVNTVGSAAAFGAASLGGILESAERAQTLRESGVPDAVVDATVERGDAWAYWVVVAVWLGSSLYALYLKPEYVQWRTRHMGPQNVIGWPSQHIPPPPPPHPSSRVWGAPEPSASTVQITNHIYGGVNNVNAQATVVQAGGNVKGVNGGRVDQSAVSSGLQPEVVLAFISRYRAALAELDPDSRQAAEAELALLAVAISSPQPDEAMVNRQLLTLKALAQQAIASGAAKAAATAGSALMATLLSNWPF